MTRILIADDHAIVRSGVRSILEAQPGWEVVGEAETGKDAVDRALATRPDIVVLDYALPVMNGIEATRQIRARVAGAEVLIFTMHDTATLVREVLEAGAKGFLLKSYARKFLIAAVESLAAHQPFFTGNFFPIDQLPRWAHVLAQLNPLHHTVELVRHAAFGWEGWTDVLRVGVKTVETQRASALRKLNLDTTAALIRYAIRNRIVED